MKKLLVLSGKGGTGKTTISSSIIALSNAKAFCDCDVDAPNLHLMKKFKNSGTESDFIGGDKAFIDENKCIGCGKCLNHCNFNAIKIINKKAVVDEYSCEGCGVCSLVCPSSAVILNKDVAGKVVLYNEDVKFSTAKLKMGRGNSGKLVSSVKKALFNCCENEKLAVLDGSPGVGCPVMASISGVDLVLVVTEPTMSGMSDLERICKTLDITNVKGCVCVNKCDLNREMTTKIHKWCNDNKIDYVGSVSYDKVASTYINKGESVVFSNTLMADELKEVYKNVMNILEL